MLMYISRSSHTFSPVGFLIAIHIGVKLIVLRIFMYLLAICTLFENGLFPLVLIQLLVHL